MTFQYRIPGTKKQKAAMLPVIAVPQENLTGTLQGKTNVPEDEERFYRGAMKTGKILNYYVEFQIGAQGLPGYRTLDVLANTAFGWRAAEIDGITFVHRGDAKKAKDRLDDFQRVDGLNKLGISLRLGIEHIPDSKLGTQEDADRTAGEFFK